MGRQMIDTKPFIANYADAHCVRWLITLIRAFLLYEFLISEISKISVISDKVERALGRAAARDIEKALINQGFFLQWR